MNKNIKLDALFIGAHPDDIEITSSGTLLKLIKSGKKCGIVDLTLGELSTRGTIESRARETINASKILGVSVRRNLNLEDGNIVNNKENRLKLIEIIRTYKPAIVFTSFYEDRHTDHIAASKFVKECVFQSGLSKISTGNLKAFRPNKLFYFRHAYDLPISFIVDISSVFYMKMKSILAYKSQFFQPKSKEPETYISSKLFLKDVESRARFYGFKVGVEFGEPIYCEETLKISESDILKI